jgi:hypothetical protein
MNKPSHAYTKPVRAFLNSSGFHLAMRSLHPKNRNTHTAISKRRSNIVSLTNMSIPSTASSPSAVALIIPSVFVGVIHCCISSLVRGSIAIAERETP